jgi:hypothetical protein
MAASLAFGETRRRGCDSGRYKDRPRDVELQNHAVEIEKEAIEHPESAIQIVQSREHLSSL